ncbi:hypothetical protein DMH18_26450 [Streptomyces sp. WAC 06783]|uniref:hypothetical protein n=1 Tax=Streptomyces sp. WAC 06783 TaxID=2203211 RepID=UPI000F7411B6|nr:hypothetical protein [Streptomyces sp. WAC 06783]RSO06987.1 hypothetical protein DMH18_26450 [Streptomyces sp. WAC 06783]
MTDIDRVARAAELLGRQWTTRVISEIDDNGPLPRRMAARTFTDLPRTGIHYALPTLRHRGLLTIAEHDGRTCYLLTEAGEGLGDVYEALARWSRTHHYPDTAADFVSRVEAGLELLKDRRVLTALTEDQPDAPPDTADTESDTLTQANLAEPTGARRWRLTQAGQDLRGPYAELAAWTAAHVHLIDAVPPRRSALGTRLPQPPRTTPSFARTTTRRAT